MPRKYRLVVFHWFTCEGFLPLLKKNGMVVLDALGALSCEESQLQSDFSMHIKRCKTLRERCACHVNHTTRRTRNTSQKTLPGTSTLVKRDVRQIAPAAKNLLVQIKCRKCDNSLRSRGKVLATLFVEHIALPLSPQISTHAAPAKKIQHHQILPLPRKFTFMPSPPHT